jgi:hypothetical protein
MARIVELPVHLAWSGQAPYDLDDPDDEAALYSLVMSEGGAPDVRRWVDADRALALWPKLLLPLHVEAIWREFFRRYRGVDPGH